MLSVASCVTVVLPDVLMVTVTSAVGWLVSFTVYVLLRPSGTVRVVGVIRTPGPSSSVMLTVVEDGVPSVTRSGSVELSSRRTDSPSSLRESWVVLNDIDCSVSLGPNVTSPGTE